jgi:hypothetical protein
MAAGASADWVNAVPAWSSSTVSTQISSAPLYRHNGRYIYSMRGGGSGTLDVYDIGSNVWRNGVSYWGGSEGFNTGSFSVDFNGGIFIQKENSGRIFRCDINDFEIRPYAWNLLPQSTTIAGDKMFVQTYRDGATTLRWLYTLHHSRTELVRMLDI